MSSLLLLDARLLRYPSGGLIHEPILHQRLEAAFDEGWVVALYTNCGAFDWSTDVVTAEPDLHKGMWAQVGGRIGKIEDILPSESFEKVIYRFSEASNMGDLSLFIGQEIDVCYESISETLIWMREALDMLPQSAVNGRRGWIASGSIPVGRKGDRLHIATPTSGSPDPERWFAEHTLNLGDVTDHFQPLGPFRMPETGQIQYWMKWLWNSVSFGTDKCLVVGDFAAATAASRASVRHLTFAEWLRNENR